MSQIIRREEDGVEFFTDATTGESGMSQSGLARFCGVTKQAIDKLINGIASAVSTSSLPDCLKPLMGEDLHGQLEAEYKNADILRDRVCAAIVEYYAFESKRKTKRALYAYRKFANMGMRSFIQDITGWQQPVDTLRSKETEILQDFLPIPWISGFRNNYLLLGIGSWTQPTKD